MMCNLIALLFVIFINISPVWAQESQKPTGRADCDAMATANEDATHCVQDLAVDQKNIYYCDGLDFRSTAKECLKNVIRIALVTPQDCRRMAKYKDMCLDLVAEKEK